jgi:hypothetical protein
MGWVSLRAQRVAVNGEIVSVQPGDPIPSANGWHNRDIKARHGLIAWHPLPGEPVFPPPIGPAQEPPQTSRAAPAADPAPVVAIPPAPPSSAGAAPEESPADVGGGPAPSPAPKHEPEQRGKRGRR